MDIKKTLKTLSLMGAISASAMAAQQQPNTPVQKGFLDNVIGAITYPITRALDIEGNHDAKRNQKYINAQKGVDVEADGTTVANTDNSREVIKSSQKLGEKPYVAPISVKFHKPGEIRIEPGI